MKAMKINPELMDPEKYEENHIKECAEILLEAEEIKKDPVLMKHIDEYLKEKKGKIKSLQDLRDKYDEVSEKNSKLKAGVEEEEDAEE